MPSARELAAEDARLRRERGTELQLAERVSAYLRKMRRQGRAVWYLKVRGGPMQRAGVPDFLLCLRGRFGSLELKDPRAISFSPTALQRKELRDIHRAGGFAWVMNDYEEILLNIEAVMVLPKVAQHAEGGSEERALYGEGQWNRREGLGLGVPSQGGAEDEEPNPMKRKVMKRLRSTKVVEVEDEDEDEDED